MFFVGEIKKVRRDLRFAGQDMITQHFGPFVVSEVGNFDAGEFLRVLKRARRCRNGPVDGVGPNYANLVFSVVTEDPNTWITGLAAAYEDLNQRMDELSDHMESLALSLDRSVQIIKRRDQVNFLGFTIFAFFQFFS